MPKKKNTPERDDDVKYSTVRVALRLIVPKKLHDTDQFKDLVVELGKLDRSLPVDTHMVVLPIGTIGEVIGLCTVVRGRESVPLFGIAEANIASGLRFIVGAQAVKSFSTSDVRRALRAVQAGAEFKRIAGPGWVAPKADGEEPQAAEAVAAGPRASVRYVTPEALASVPQDGPQLHARIIESINANMADLGSNLICATCDASKSKKFTDLRGGHFILMLRPDMQRSTATQFVVVLPHSMRLPCEAHWCVESGDRRSRMIHSVDDLDELLREILNFDHVLRFIRRHVKG